VEEGRREEEVQTLVPWVEWLGHSNYSIFGCWWGVVL